MYTKASGFIYLASPYSHEDAEVRYHRYQESLRVTAMLMESGKVVFSPIVHTHYLDGRIFGADHKFWMKMDLPLLAKADALYVLMLDGWDVSKGVAEEIKFATDKGISIFYLTSDGYFAGAVEKFPTPIPQELCEVFNAPMQSVKPPDKTLREVTQEAIDGAMHEYSTKVSSYALPNASDAIIQIRKSNQNILEEANSLVHGDRRNSYGHPLDDFTRTGKMWAAILGLTQVTPEEVGLCMAAVKLSRECNQHKRDNLVDAAGYAETISMIYEERKQRKDKNPSWTIAINTSDAGQTK